MTISPFSSLRERVLKLLDWPQDDARRDLARLQQQAARLWWQQPSRDWEGPEIEGSIDFDFWPPVWEHITELYLEKEDPLGGPPRFPDATEFGDAVAVQADPPEMYEIIHLPERWRSAVSDTAEVLRWLDEAMVGPAEDCKGTVPIAKTDAAPNSVPRTKVTPQKRRIAERRKEAQKLHKAGRSQKQIAIQLAVSESTVCRDLIAAIDEG